MTRPWLVVVAAALVFSACSSGDGAAERRIVGTVTQVVGLEEVLSFIVTDEDGTNHGFVPRPGLTCGGEDLTHLRVHIIERDLIAVSWFDDAGIRIAESIEHLEG